MNSQGHHIEACRHYTGSRYRNIVYLRTLKCASTFFYWNFTKNFDWQEISWSDIDWDHDHVFSHMLDPVHRRHKALAERLCMFGLGKQYLADSNLRQCLEHSLNLDQHGEGYTTRYGSAVNRIDWIPLYSNQELNVELTEKLLANSGVTDLTWDYEFAHAGEDVKKQVELLLTQTWDRALNHGKLFDWQQNELQNDLDLYKQVTTKFDLHGASWDNMSWLK